MKVVGLGEIMMRLSTDKGVLVSNTNNFNVNYGGGEANVLISLSKFGIDTRFISKISNNSIGQAILEYLNSKRIDTNFISKGEERTGIYFLEMGSGNRNSKVIYDRKNSCFSNIKLSDINIEEALKDVDIFHFSGITLALSEEIRKIILEIIKVCMGKNILVSYDSNYRSTLWSLEEAREATLEILPYVNILSAGILDAENILKINCEYDDKYEKLNYYYNHISNNYPNIKYTFSSFRDIKSASTNTLQCNYFIDNKLYSSEIRTIDDIVDRVGGGDALTAGIIYCILNNKEPKYTVEFANCVSVLKHTIYGDANFVSVGDVEDLIYNGVGKINR
ncbi:pfkB carbohydrate kinase family protein [Clostridium sporogenes]|uniref:PfkB carbohydrate kinase family protein n=1 Tax=Clostridium sporogenes TaxID=1509 RepID=A0A1L3NBF1_CLOSG|nr:sugar kinase [Clostridium sporogenes]APH13433.1 pfkB carbohydrate kinase family protein [Clostridium sporogenes]